ncbi:MAG: rhodanese-like domain-containing protein, partial [Candidatus Eremiobacteraeota bacterium]|nr:rhodanese-like domain-containing protein [Candidatus Eremiobacteraeota bacterium]
VREVRFERDRDCALCGDEPAIRDAVLEEDDEPFTGDVEEIAPERLDDALRDAVLLDVREPHEAVLGSVDGAIAMPATQLEARMHELDSARRYVVACRVGAKSLWAVRRLRDAGFTRLQHLRGGLLAYAAQRADFDFF